MTPTASIHRWRRLVSSLLHHPLLFVHLLITQMVPGTRHSTHRAGPALLTPKWLSHDYHQRAKPGDPGEAPRLALLALAFQLSRIHKDLPLPPCPGPGSQITQHAPVPCQFGSTNVYFQRNLSRPLLVQVPHNSSPAAVCAMLRDTV